MRPVLFSADCFRSVTCMLMRKMAVRKVSEPYHPVMLNVCEASFVDGRVQEILRWSLG